MTTRSAIRLACLLSGVTLALVFASIALLVAFSQAPDIGDVGSLPFFVFSIMGMLIVIRQPKHAVGWLFLVIGFAAALTISGYLYGALALYLRPGSLPAGEWVALAGIDASSALWMIFFAIVLLFPDGKLPSARWKPFAYLACTSAVLLTVAFAIVPGPLNLAHGTTPTVPNPLGMPWLAGLIPLLNLSFLIFFPMAVVCLASPVFRFRRARGEERQQLKWLVYWVSFLAFWIAAYTLNRMLNYAQSWSWVFDVAGALGAAGVPVVMTMAILRYRLYDIDLIIRRTLVYGTLTASLGLMYWGGVVGLQSLLRPITGEGNDIAIVAVTLLIAALFLPLRRIIQAFIDRRFYRRKYDAAKTLAEFSTTARDEVDLDKLTSHLTDVAAETMQPSHISLWLKPAQRREMQ